MKLLILFVLLLNCSLASARSDHRERLERLKERQKRSFDCSKYSYNELLERSDKLKSTAISSSVFFSISHQILKRVRKENPNLMSPIVLQEYGRAFRSITEYFDEMDEQYKYLKDFDKSAKYCKSQKQENKLAAQMYILTSMMPYVHFYDIFNEHLENFKFTKIMENGDLSFDREDNDFYKHMTKVVENMDFKKLEIAMNEATKRRVKLSPELQKRYDQHSKYVVNYSNYFSTVKKISKLKIIGRKIKEEAYDSFQFVFEKVATFVGMAAYRMVFGTGALLDNKVAINDMKKNLQPLDMLLYNAPFKLNAKLIPGYWGHSSMWFGTKKQLQELDLWDHPMIIPYHKLLLDGRNVIESMNLGVNLYTIESSMNIDNLGVFRKLHMSKDEIRAKLLVAIKQIGKEFDFGFDALDAKKLVCSEVIYQTFNNVNFTLTNTMGKTTFSPNTIMTDSLSGKTPNIKPVLLYLKGKRVHSDDLERDMAELGND